MKTIIFKSEKKAKIYEIRSAKTEGVYKAGELMQILKTDDIESATTGHQYEITATKI
jgi:hypothetical protein